MPVPKFVFTRPEDDGWLAKGLLPVDKSLLTLHSLFSKFCKSLKCNFCVSSAYLYVPVADAFHRYQATKVTEVHKLNLNVHFFAFCYCS